MKQLTLWESEVAAPRRHKSQNYEEFVEKFKPKLTTDDCYTPPAVYDAVLSWVRRNCDIDGCNILRPFYPGGDFEAEEYGPHDVVVDNPPFSIITRIVKWYMARGVRFFLFAPHLTVFNPGRYCTSIVAAARIIYHNGAVVNTSFVSNMFGNIAVMSAPDLYEEITAGQRGKNKKVLSKYRYPVNVIKSTSIERFSRCGIRFSVSRSEVRFITRLDEQGNAGIFGGGYLISDRAAADRAAADRAAADRAAADQTEIIEWQLSLRERRIIEEELNPRAGGVNE